MTENEPTPQEHTLDNSLALLKDGYDFIFKRRREMDTDIFQTRLLGQKAICIGGKEAAELFYDTSKFQRSGAIPKRIQKSLFGENAIQTMDGEAHRHRKAMFMSLMSRDSNTCERSPTTPPMRSRSGLSKSARRWPIRSR